MSDVAIRVEGLGKEYRIGKRERYKTLRDTVADPKAGACDTLYRLTNDPRLNHRAQVLGGVAAERCALLLSEFFAGKRRLGKK